MRMVLILFFLWTGMIAFAQGAELLVTKAGTYSSEDKKTSVDITTPTPSHMNIQMTFTIQMQIPNHEGKVEVADSRRLENLPLQPGWAICISKNGDVWFYAGPGALTEFQRKEDQIVTLKSCSEPDLVNKSPKVLKQWIAEHFAKLDSAGKGGQPLGSNTNATSSVAGSPR